MTSKEIKIALLNKGIKAVDIARSLKVSHASLHNVVYGKATSCRIKTAVAAALGMDINDIWPPKATPKTFTELDYVLAASERMGLSMESDSSA